MQKTRYELAPYPISIFNEYGAMHRCTQKSKLVIGMKVELSARTVGKPDAFFLIGCAIFWAFPWPSKGTIGSLLKIF